MDNEQWMMNWAPTPGIHCPLVIIHYQLTYLAYATALISRITVTFI
jgi:hypothetical protein